MRLQDGKLREREIFGRNRYIYRNEIGDHDRVYEYEYIQLHDKIMIY